MPGIAQYHISRTLLLTIWPLPKVERGKMEGPKLNYRSPVTPSDYMVPHIIPPYHINWAGPVYWLSSVYSMVIPQLKLVNKFGNLNSIKLSSYIYIKTFQNH